MNVDRPCINPAFVLQTILILDQIPSKLPTRRESGSSPRYLYLMPVSGVCSSEFPSPTAANPVPISDAKPPRPSDVDSEASGVGECTTLRDLEVGVRATRHVQCDLSTTVQGQVDCEHILYTKQQVMKVGGVRRTCGEGMHSSCERNESSTKERKSDAGILGRRGDLVAGFLSLRVSSLHRI